MEQLPIDVLRETALRLPLKDIFKLCRTNKRFQQHICNYKPFWEVLFLREVDEKIEIPLDANIRWFQHRLEQWPSVKNLVGLIRENKVQVKYIQPFDESWDSFEIIENLSKLNCDGSKIVFLPDMPNLIKLDCVKNQLIILPLLPKIEELFCEYNKLTVLPSFPNLKILGCNNNQLTSLPSYPNLTRLFCHNNKLITLPIYPNLRVLYCNNNKLISLPSMPKLQRLNCDNNKLKSLPPMPKLKFLSCENNPLPFDDIRDWFDEWGLIYS